MLLLVQLESPLPTVKADFVSPSQDCGLVLIICEWEGLVSAGFKVGRTGFGSFRHILAGFHWVRVILLFRNYLLFCQLEAGSANFWTYLC